jgi:hypothetical protein
MFCVGYEGAIGAAARFLGLVQGSVGTADKIGRIIGICRKVGNILSHVAAYPLTLVDEQGRLERVDPAILLEVGACPIVLRRPGNDVEMNGLLLHDLPDHSSIVCHESGIVEPITLSILRFLGSEGERAQE